MKAQTHCPSYLVRNPHSYCICVHVPKDLKKPRTQDDRKLLIYRCGWKVERRFAYVKNFGMLVTCSEYYVDIFLVLVQLGFSIIFSFILRSVDVANSAFSKGKIK